MKVLFAFVRRAGWLPKAGILVFLLVGNMGCKKTDNVPPPSAPPAPSNSLSNAAAPMTAPPPAPLQPSFQANPGNTNLTQLQVLNRALMGWMIKNRRHPRNFEDFASTANVQIPAPPAGQKYTLNQRGFVVLINSTQ